MLVLSGHGELLNPTLYSWRPIIRKNKKNKMYHNARLVRKEKKRLQEFGRERSQRASVNHVVTFRLLNLK
jgi:hypothetical protein